MKPEYQGKIVYKWKCLPLEIRNQQETPQEILDQEWWLAAIQEPAAQFVRWERPYPPTFLPAFDALKCAELQGQDCFDRFDLRVREAFFGEARNVAMRHVLIEVAEEAGLDVDRFTRDFDSGAQRKRVIEECNRGWYDLRVEGSPTLVTPDGRQFFAPAVSHPRWKNRKVIGVPPLPCCGDDCLEIMRGILNQAVGA